MVAQRRSSHRKLDFGRGFGYRDARSSLHMRTSSRLGKGGQVQIRPKAVCQRLEVDLGPRRWTAISGKRPENRIRHDLLGSYLARAWGISSLVETVTKWHHEEDRSKRYDIEDAQIQKLVDIVYLANGTIHRLGVGNSGHRFKQVSFQADFAQVAHGGRGLPEFRE